MKMEVFQFADFTLDVPAHALTRQGARIELPPLSFDLLVLLVRSAPASVSRKHLLESLWPDRVVGEEALTERVKLLRQAIEVDATRPELVKTERGFGYRFAAKVRPVQKPMAGKRTRLRPAAALLAVFVVAIAAGFFYLRSGPAGRDGITLAIVPFEDLTPGADAAHIATGVVEEINGRLAKLDPDRLAILGRATSSGLSSEPALAKTLGVDYLLAGSIRDRGASRVVAVQLADTVESRQIWHGEFPIPRDGSLRWQRELVNDVAIALRLKALPLPDSEPVVSVEAREAYWRGRYEWRRWTGQGFLSAIAHFERSLELDPAFAAAHAGLADALTTSIYSGLLAAEEALPRARLHAHEALALDAGSARAQLSLAMISLYYDREPEQAAATVSRLLAADPHNTDVLLAFANIRWVQGCSVEAIASMQTATRIDPSASILRAGLGFSYFLAGDYRNALDQATIVLDAEPGYAHARYIAAMAATQLGDTDRALEVLDGAADDALVSALGYVLVQDGQTDRARALLDRAWSPTSHIPRARLLAALGDSRRASMELEHAHSKQMAAVLLVPRYPSLRFIPRQSAVEAALSGLDGDCR